MHVSSLLVAAVSFATVRSAAIPTPSINPSIATAREILKAENGSWFENIAVRSNGQLLATRLDVPSVYQVDPCTGSYSVIANFTGVTAAFGIAEYAPDVFAIAIGNLSRQTFAAAPGTYSIQTIDLSKGLGADGKVEPELLVEVPAAGILNGLTFRAPSTLYSADSFTFQIWGIDVGTRTVSTAVPENALFSKSDADGFPTGVNGLKWDEAGQELFFTNSNQVLAGRVPLNKTTNLLEAPVELARGIAGTIDFDDLAVDPYRGNLYLANGLHGVNFLSRDGKTQELIAQSNNYTLNSPTAAIFGKCGQQDVLFITTSGLDANSNAVGGQIVAYTFAHAG